MIYIIKKKERGRGRERERGPYRIWFPIIYIYISFVWTNLTRRQWDAHVALK